MKHYVLFFLGLITAANFVNAESVEDVPRAVEYVKVCSIYGAGYFYIPGTDQCYHVNTGIVKQATEYGVLVSESGLASRISQLEAELQYLYAQFGIQRPKKQHKSNQ